MWTSLRRAARELAAAERDLAAPLGLSLVQGQALLVLADSGPVTMQEFADRLCIAPSTATRLADQIEEKGWAKREVDPADRRRNVLELAEPGLVLVDGLMDRGVIRTHAVAREVDDALGLAHSLDQLADVLHEVRSRES